MRQSYRLVYNAFVSWAARVAEMAVQFLLLPFLVHRVGADGYGIFLLAFSISQSLDVVRNAVGQALNKYVSAFAAQDRKDEINRVLGTACAFSTVAGLVLAGGLISLRDVLAGAFDVPEEFSAQFQRAILMMAGLVAVSFPLMPYLGVLFGYQRHDITRVSQTAVRYLGAGLMVAWFLLVSPSIDALVAITLICGLLLHLCWYGAARWQWPWLRGSPRQFRWSTLSMLFSFSALIFLIGLTNVLNGQGPRWLLADQLSVEFVTYIAIMSTPSTTLSHVIHDLTLTIMPVASRFQALEDRRRLVELLVRGTRYSLLASAVCVAVLMPIMGPFLRLWMGPEFEHLATSMNVILAATMINMSGLAAHNMLKGMGAVGQVFWRGLLQAIATLGVMYAAIKFFNLTHWGIAAGLSTGAVFSGVLHNWMCVRLVGAPMGRFLWHTYGHVAVAMAPVMAAGWFITQRVGPHGVIPLSVIGVSCALAFVGLFVFLFLTKAEWQLARDVLRAAKRKLLAIR